MSVEHKAKISAGNKGKTLASGRKPLSEETKLKMSLAAAGRPFKRIYVTCTNCGMTLDKANHNKYHGTKCKSIL